MESSVTKVALVTGAVRNNSFFYDVNYSLKLLIKLHKTFLKFQNKGIGYAIVRNLALKYASETPLTVFMTARDSNLGQESLKKIKQELKSKKVLRDDGGKVDVKFLRMDLTDEQSIKDVKDVLAHDNGTVAAV